MQELVSAFVFFFAVIDPIGTVPVFLQASRGRTPAEHRKIAVRAVAFAAALLLAFMLGGQALLDAIGVPLASFRISGGIVLFLFALTMILGESKPESEKRLTGTATDVAFFPVAVPSLASPGAMLAAVIWTDRNTFDAAHNLRVAAVVLVVLACALTLLLLGRRILAVIGDSGATVASRIMGLILSAVAVNEVVLGIRESFV